MKNFEGNCEFKILFKNKLAYFVGHNKLDQKKYAKTSPQ